MEQDDELNIVSPLIFVIDSYVKWTKILLNAKLFLRIAEYPLNY